MIESLVGVCPFSNGGKLVILRVFAAVICPFLSRKAIVNVWCAPRFSSSI